MPLISMLNVQDLESGAVAYVLRNATSQTIISYITAHCSGKDETFQMRTQGKEN